MRSISVRAGAGAGATRRVVYSVVSTAAAEASGDEFCTTRRAYHQQTRVYSPRRPYELLLFIIIIIIMTRHHFSVLLTVRGVFDSIVFRVFDAISLG